MDYQPASLPGIFTALGRLPKTIEAQLAIVLTFKYAGWLIVFLSVSVCACLYVCVYTLCVCVCMCLSVCLCVCACLCSVSATSSPHLPHVTSLPPPSCTPTPPPQASRATHGLAPDASQPACGGGHHALCVTQRAGAPGTVTPCAGGPVARAARGVCVVVGGAVGETALWQEQQVVWVVWVGGWGGGGGLGLGLV